MARIPREEHATIRHRVDVEGVKVAEVATAYGCTPANIYAILARQRRPGNGDASAPGAMPTVVGAGSATVGAVPLGPVGEPVTDEAGSAAPATTTPVTSTLARATPVASATAASATAASKSDTSKPYASGQVVSSAALAKPGTTSARPAAPPVPPRPSRGGAAPRGAAPATAARAGKMGYALMMRSGDGEEAVNPFRSLEDLLAASKPILRNAARSAEPVWFSIQQVDLDALEDSE